MQHLYLGILPFQLKYGYLKSIVIFMAIILKKTPTGVLQHTIYKGR